MPNSLNICGPYLCCICKKHIIYHLQRHSLDTLSHCRMSMTRCFHIAFHCQVREKKGVIVFVWGLVGCGWSDSLGDCKPAQLAGPKAVGQSQGHVLVLSCFFADVFSGALFSCAVTLMFRTMKQPALFLIGSGRSEQ